MLYSEWRAALQNAGEAFPSTSEGRPLENGRVAGGVLCGEESGNGCRFTYKWSGAGGI